MSIPTGRMFAKALEDAGVVSGLDTVQRIVIDIDSVSARVYVQRIADHHLLEAFGGPLGMMLADAGLAECAPGCDLRSAHQAPDECQSATEGGGM